MIIGGSEGEEVVLVSPDFSLKKNISRIIRKQQRETNNNETKNH